MDNYTAAFMKLISNISESDDDWLFGFFILQFWPGKLHKKIITP